MRHLGPMRQQGLLLLIMRVSICNLTTKDILLSTNTTPILAPQSLTTLPAVKANAQLVLSTPHGDSESLVVRLPSLRGTSWKAVSIPAHHPWMVYYTKVCALPSILLQPSSFLRLNPLTADFSLYQRETWRPSYPTCQTVYLFRPSSSQEPTTRKYASSQATHLQPSPNPGWHSMAGPYRNAKPPQHPSQRNSNQEFAS